MKKYFKRILFTPSIARLITRLLARIHQFSYSYLGAFAVAAEGGLHPKHRLMQYHNFFADNVLKGEHILDVGCGNGSLLIDIARKTGAVIVGVDISEANVESAREMLSDFSKVKIIHSDIREFNSSNKFDTVILSNVLEHIDRRVELLQQLKTRFNPRKLLIRVPMFEREWLVPYKKELGIEWRLDPTHEIEYTESEFKDEISKAGLELETIVFRWGEIYAVARPLEHEA